MDNLFNKMGRACAVRKKDKNAQHNQRSKRQLEKIIEKKFKTTFIGALSCFEKEFGFLWGQGKDVSELTEEEKRMAALRQKVRTDVLNNGNNQCRAVMNEMRQYDISWNGYNVEFDGGNNAVKED